MSAKLSLSPKYVYSTLVRRTVKKSKIVYFTFQKWHKNKRNSNGYEFKGLSYAQKKKYSKIVDQVTVHC